MYCPKCGANLPEASKFCSSCGSSLAEPAQQQKERENIISEAGKPEKERALVKPKKKSKLPRMLIAAAMVVVIIAGSLTVKGAIGSFGKSGNTYVYLSDGKYELLTNPEKNNAIEIASSRGSSASESLVAFSGDGKYLYYFSKFDPIANTGTLCRAEYGKLKKNSSKNDKYIEIIASNVRADYTMPNNKAMLYQNGDSTLYYYDGVSSIQIAKSVNWYKSDGSRLIYETGASDEGPAMYSAMLSSIEDKNKLASNYTYTVSYNDLDHILYAKTNDENNSTLYVVGFDKEAQKLADKANCMYMSPEVTYYSTENGTGLNLYDYVEDSYQAADAGMTEPNLENYKIPQYKYVQLNKDTNPNDYEEIYTSCTQPLYFWNRGNTFEYAVEYYADKYPELQAFIDKYKETENEAGYFVVTDEIKKDLQNFSATLGQKYDGEWLEFCLAKEPNGYDYDYDSYYADKEVYDQAANRIAIRTELQNNENSYPVKSLYCYRNGEVSLVCNNMLDFRSYGNVVIYNTPDLITEPLNMEEVMDVSQVQALFSLNLEKQNYFVTGGSSSPVQLSANAAETLASANSNDAITLSSVPGVLFMNGSGGELSVALIDNGTVGNFEIISDDAAVLNTITADKMVYYASNIHESNGYSYGDLYVYDNGSRNQLAQDILLLNVFMYEDGAIMAYSNYNSSYGYELTQVDAKGDASVIADDVSQYIRVDSKNILYISDRDLYSYDGKEKKLITSNVDWVWSLSSMKKVNQLSSNYNYY